MIKFFRNIRKNLLAQGKTGKYLKYALGEIVLVVVGILQLPIGFNGTSKGKFKGAVGNIANGIVFFTSCSIRSLINHLTYTN
ncbi:hypothetical protein [Flagellimonas sp. GZD32]|uniref:hypothetical protein n=1 Tax=Flagellimonas cixiensis TaxID=3228750 RepID=UPI0035C90DA3